jgi:hypothetical protein
MEPISLSTLGKPLVSIGRALAPLVKQLRAVRQAGADSAHVKVALLDAALETTLNRLHDIESHVTWWGELLQRAETAYVRPDYLAKPTIRDWLSEAAVRDDLKTLALAALLPRSGNQAAIIARVADRYAHHTGEAAPLAAGPIQAIVNILLAGTLAPGTKGDFVVAGLVQQGYEQMNARLDTIEGKIGALSSNDLVIRAHTEKCEGAAAKELIGTYIAAFQQTYGPLANELMIQPCSNAAETGLLQELVKRGSTSSGFVLSGPSGCGKTLTAYRLGLDSIAGEHIPIIIRGRDFDGSFWDAVDREVALLDIASSKALLEACRQVDRRILLLVDGYNECLEVQRGKLTRGVASAARRYKARVIVTTQCPLERADLLQLPILSVSEPDLDTKIEIARRASGGVAITAPLEPLLASVASGLEARLIGEIGRHIAANASRYAIFDSYFRRRLGINATAGIGALARIAGLLTDRISFSLTIRDLDRFCEQEGITTTLTRCLHEVALLATRGDRTSFGHELFLNAFAAEEVIRRAAGNTEDVLKALNSPRHAQRKILIVGAIDDESFLASVLSEIADAEVIEACVLGQCGAFARAWAERRCTEAINRMGAEAAQACFAIVDNAMFRIAPVKESLLRWSPQERAFLGAMAALVTQGRYLDPVLDAIATMDRRLTQENARLREIASVQKVALRSGMFANCYVWSGVLAISVVCGLVHSGLASIQRSKPASGAIYERLVRSDLSFGQLYLLLSLNRGSLHEHPSIPALLPELIRRNWRGAPYHLRLDLLEAAQFCGRAPESERLALIKVLEDLPPPEHPFLSTSFVEALQSLGALQDSEEEHVDVVRSDLRKLLVDQGTPQMQALAHSTWFAQFDHPYAGAYCEAISELSSGKKKTLLVMAAQGADDDGSFIGILLLELASFNDPVVGPIIARWTALPPTECFIPQDAIGNFGVAHIVLARLACALTANISSQTSNSAKALGSAGAALYWLNRCDLPRDDRRSEAAKALVPLLRHDEGVAANVLYELHRASFMSGEGFFRLPGDEPVCVSIGEAFPDEVADICRHCLWDPDGQHGYFSNYFDRHGVLSFAIAGLGAWGNSGDIALLRMWSHDDRHGRHAISLIKDLEGRAAAAALS